MPTSRFPCRVCGQSTEGLDTYVVCLDCAADFELHPPGRNPAGYEPPGAEGSPAVPLSPDEVDARLRHLLDDW